MLSISVHTTAYIEDLVCQQVFFFKQYNRIDVIPKHMCRFIALSHLQFYIYYMHMRPQLFENHKNFEGELMLLNMV